MQPFRPEVAARLTELAPLLLDQLDAMTDRMIEVLLRTEPAYRDVLAHREEEMRESTRGNLEQGLHLLIGAASGNVRTSLREARDVGRRRAAQGIPLEAVLRAYRLGGQVTWEALLEVSRRSNRHDTLLLEVAGSVWRTNDVECAAVAEGYREEQRRLAGVDDSARQRVLDGLVEGRGGDPAFVRTASE
ncbi:MAG TPA: PucR family transcriptional regulator, partial [Blastococcus sp.]